MNVRTTVSVCAAAVAVVSGLVHANISGTLRYINMDGAFRWRDGSVAQEQLLVISLVDVNGDGFLPPSTNAADDYCAEGDAKSINESSPTALGFDGVCFKARLLTNGMVLGLIESPGRDSRKAKFRCFSAKRVGDAAYFADGGEVELKALPDRWVNDKGSWMINQVNPAYTQLRFDQLPQRRELKVGTHQPPCTVITGSVNTFPGGSNNMLDNNIVMVYWRTNAAQRWLPLSDYRMQDEGDFSGTCPAVTELMVGMVVDADALPSSLLGQGPVVFERGKDEARPLRTAERRKRPAAEPAPAPASTNGNGWVGIEEPKEASDK